jgi:hypothetical protein
VNVQVDEFVAILERHKDVTRQRLNQFCILFIMACIEQVVVGGEFGPGTPVDTGYLRAMWWLSINGSGQSPNLQKPDTSGRKKGEPMLFASDDPSSGALDILAGDHVSLNNNTEYASYVENGTEHMAPRAMVKTVANAAQAIAHDAANNLGIRVTS